jgi:hypothetical protein
MKELCVYSTIMSLGNRGVFQFRNEVTFSGNSDVLQFVGRVLFLCDGWLVWYLLDKRN